ncbi:hypothetical protein BKA01_005903 [Pseudonocardia eucalypti]|uniref:hypothetical protein n=1 Tax=Pseudonocardia eucalypti TaxID=648755 RepID=UPI0016194637|nr:hypothetical protein [Pseudonocardia eucalypti]
MVRGQGIELVIEDTDTGARAEVTGTVTQVIGNGTANMVGRAHVRGRARRLPLPGAAALRAVDGSETP